jgi:hypothetical protein
MIYTVELNYSDPSTVNDWNAWYETYLCQLVSLDGLDTAQRFRAQSPDTQFWEYLAIYTVPNLDVYETETYRAIGGGGNASKAYHHAISRRRNVYNGVARMPEVNDDTCVLFCEDAADGIDLPGVLFVPLRAGVGNQQAGATKIDGKPEQRSIALTDATMVDRIGVASIEGLAVYAPITRYYS